MTQLFTVSFTTQKRIKRYDAKGKLESETRLDTPITMHALPHATAISYQNCDNFAITPYVMEDQRRSRGPARDDKVGNGTKRTPGRQVDFDAVSDRETARLHVKRDRLGEAAATGDMTAAINA